MAQWIEVKVRYEKRLTDSGKTAKVTDSYLVDALSCTEAEARAAKEIQPLCSEFNVLSVNKTKISEVFWNGDGDRFYKVKVNYITLDEKTATEKKSASYVLVQASDFAEALQVFTDGMRGTMADYEIEGINETKIVDVYRYETAESRPSASGMAERVAADENVRHAAKGLREALPEGASVSACCIGPDGKKKPGTEVVGKIKPKCDDD